MSDVSLKFKFKVDKTDDKQRLIESLKRLLRYAPISHKIGKEIIEGSRFFEVMELKDEYVTFANCCKFRFSFDLSRAQEFSVDFINELADNLISKSNLSRLQKGEKLWLVSTALEQLKVKWKTRKGEIILEGMDETLDEILEEGNMIVSKVVEKKKQMWAVIDQFGDYQSPLVNTRKGAREYRLKLLEEGFHPKAVKVVKLNVEITGYDD